MKWKGEFLDDSSGSLILIMGLLLIEALLNLGFGALQNTRQVELQQQAEQGKQYAKTALSLLRNPSRISVTYSLVITLLHFAMALAAAIWIVVPAAAGQSSISLTVANMIVIAVGAGVVVLGYMVPEAIGSAYALVLTSIMIYPLRLLIVVCSPVTALLLVISRLLAKAFGSERQVNTVTEEEIMTLIDAGHTGGTIEEEEKAMIFSVMQLDETIAREMMVPRIDMITLEAKSSVQSAVDVFLESGFSRIPVYEDNVDNIVGLIYAKDVLALLKNGGLAGHSVRDLVRSAYFVPETRPADKLLRDMQAHNIHMAIVVDEYGGTAGLVTIENIMEEIVGDIRDEFDINEEYEYIQNSDTEYLIDAGMDIDDINELLNTTIDSEETDTLGGYIYLKIGRVPLIGETVEDDLLIMRIHSVEGRRIRKVLVTLKPRNTGTEGTGTAESQQQIADTP